MPPSPMRAGDGVVAEPGADGEGHRLLGWIGVILYMDRLWLQRLDGIASRWRTCASSQGFGNRRVLGATGQEIGA